MVGKSKTVIDEVIVSFVESLYHPRCPFSQAQTMNLLWNGASAWSRLLRACRRSLPCLVSFGALLPVPASAALDEGFDDISALSAAGWVVVNASSPLGTNTWFQGNSSVFAARDGAWNAYIGVNFQSTTSVGTISNWLITPEIQFGIGATLTFWTRKVSPDDYPDRLEVRVSANGASTDTGGTATSVGDFTNRRLTINPWLEWGSYPTTWTRYTVTGFPTTGSGRIAFRYHVTSGGSNGANSDYIGIDRVQYTPGTPSYAVGGNVAGLVGSGLVLNLNGGNALPVAANGSFQFASPLMITGGAYQVSIAAQPSAPPQVCTVADGTGTVGSANVTSVQVSCVTTPYTVSGTVSGLASSGLVLRLNGGDDLPIASDGSFQFSTLLVPGTAYAVTVYQQPTAMRRCTVANGSGVMGAGPVSSVQVDCVFEQTVPVPVDNPWSLAL